VDSNIGGSLDDMDRIETGRDGVARRAVERSAQPLGFEEQLWRTADKLRGSMDAAEYKHVVLGLIFLKYISDTFTAKRDELRRTLGHPDSPDYIPDAAFREELLESRDEYLAEGVFWVPPEARWEAIAEHAGQEGLGRRIDHAMELVEKQNPSLRGVLPKDYAARPLDPRRLAELVNLVGQIPLAANHHGGNDVLGRVYEYFLGKFASAEGKGGGEFYTPESVVKLLVEMLEPYSGRVYDPCCGSGGMFVQATRFVEAHAGRRDDISVYGQESNPTTWKLARMNLAIRHIDANLGSRAADTFHDDLHPDLVADFVLANPPFNVSDWGGEHLRRDARWRYGAPPVGNANFAWLEHIASKLSTRGVAGVVLANGSMSSRSGGEGEIRRAMVEGDLVDCMVALPTQLFFNTGIPACLWFLARDKSSRRKPGWRDRRGEVLFIDARRRGHMETRVHRVLDPDDISKIADVYHAWRGEQDAGDYVDIPGFCYAAKLPEIREHDHVLTPGRYVGAEESEDDGEPIEDKIRRLRKELEEAFAESNRQQEKVRDALRRPDV
jgi:type I restriction enzyme M protein